MAIRSISLVDRLELEIQGGLFQNALAFGDVDMDGKNELVVCNGWGQLAIFKGINSKPWSACSGLGCVTVVIVGDIQNLQRNVIFCINTEGWCHLFDLEIFKMRKISEDLETEIEEKVSPTKSTKSPQHTAEQIQPTYKQKLRPNPRMAVLEDIDNDGIKELIICYTDRVVKIFKWITDVPDEGLCSALADNRGATSGGAIPKKQLPKDEDRRPQSLIKQSSKDSGKDFFAKSPKLSEVVPPPKKELIDGSVTQTVKGRFSLLQSFSVPGQIGSVSVCKNATGQTQLMASQPGGGYVILATYDTSNNVERKDSKMTNQQQTEQYGIYYPAAMIHRSRNLLVNTELLGSLRRQGSLSGLTCLCTLDGSFALIDHENISLPSVSRTTEHTWFAMDTLDVTDDGNDEIVLCSWDGVTYLIDKDNDVMSYNFGENICAFRAGMYAVSSDKNVPCFCYATFSNRIMLYFNVKVDNMKSRCVHDALLERIRNRPEFDAVLQKLKDSDGKINSVRIQQLIKETLS